MKVICTFLSAIVLIFAFYLSFPFNNPSAYLQSVCVLVEDINGSGSGLVILHKNETYILTCAHVVSNIFGFDMPVNIVHYVYKDRKLIKKYVYIAKVKYKDTKKDIALLHIDVTTHFKNTIHLTKEPYCVIGDQIWMVGSMYGSPCYNTVTKGIVSRYDYLDMFRYQIDSSIYGGMSGGGMFSDNGRFLGMFCSWRNPTVGYVIPSQTISDFVRKNCPELLGGM